MSATSGTQASTNKGETSTSKSSKSGYDHLDINKLYKGKSTEPVAKTVTQKHGMQALGKALPARRGGSTVVKAEPTPGPTNNGNSSSNDVINSSNQQAPAKPVAPPPHNLPPHPQQYPHHPHHSGPPGWQQQQNSSQNFPPVGASSVGPGSGGGPPRPPGPQSPHHPPHHPLQSNRDVPNAAKTGGGGPMHDKNWSGGAPHENNSGGPPGRGPPPGQQQRAQQAAAQAAQESMQRFAQEFPSLDSGGGDGSKGGNASAQGKNQDNQYGPGPILRPQTEGSWTQGGGRGMTRPPGPPPPSSAGGAPGASSSNRDFGPERPNMGGPTPPPMSLGQGGHPPPPLGAFPMQFPPRAPYMYPNAGPGGPGGPPGGQGFYPPGPRYGMPIPPGAPPPSSNHPSDGPREEGGPPPRRAGRGPPPGQMRPASHFASKPIIKAEELERMDELGQQDGGWATVQDDIDYNKKISFSDDEGQQGVGGDKENGRGRRLREDDRGENRTPRDTRDRDYPDEMRDRSSRPMRILERPQASDPRDQRDSRNERDGRDRYGEGDGPSSGRYQNEYDSNDQDDWKRKPASGFERGDRDGRGPLSQQNRGGRMINRGPPREEEESWRSGGNNRPSNFEDDPRKKDRSGGPPSGGRGDRDGRGVAPAERPSERSSGQALNERNTDMRRPPPERERGDERRDRPDERRDRGDGPQRGSIGGGSGDFGPASGPFQNNLPPRLQRSFPPIFSQQQQDRVANQRKTPSPVPSGNSSNKERDYRDRSDRPDRDWDRNERNERDRDLQRPTPTYKILERNRGDSESSKDSSSHIHSRNNRLERNDTDSVPTRLHRDGKHDSNKRLSSDSGRMLLDEDSKMSPKDLDSMDSSYDSLRGGQSKQDIMEVSKSSSFTRPPRGMGSWADEVDDEQDYSSSDIDAAGSRKGSLIRDLKRGDHQVHPVEERRPPTREMPRRVIIQQTKVENMKSDVQEVRKAPEPQAVPEPKPEPVKIEKPPMETNKPKGFQWGDRAKPPGTDSTGQNQEGKDAQSVNKDSGDRDSSEKESVKSRGDDEGKGGKEDGSGSQKDSRYPDSRYGGGRFDKGGPRERDMRGSQNDRQKPRRMDSYEQKSRDNRTPDRADSGRSSQEKERESKGIEKSKSGDRLDKDRDQKEKIPDKEDFRDERRSDDYDRGNRGVRGKDRGGYGVYQPRGGSHADRGGWGRDDKGRNEGRPRGGGRQGSREYYDKSSRRMDERGGGDKEDSHREDMDRKEKKESASDLSNKGSVEDLGRDKSKGSSKESVDKGKKSPGTQRRNNNARGGARLQGYGPPSDKTPFSSGGHKDGEQQDGGKASEASGQQQNNKPAPVPLMALGDISPPNVQNKGGRGSGGREMERGRGGRGMPPRMQRDEYPREGFRGSQGQREQERSKGRGGGRGGQGDAKPLMSINSNEVEGQNEWESESGDSGEDDSKRSGTQSKKEPSGSASQQDSSAIDSKKKPAPQKTSQPPATDASQNSNKNSNSAGSKDRRVKNPPYDPRPNSKSNTWDNKTAGIKENSSQQPTIPPNSSTPALQESKEEKTSVSATTGNPSVDNGGPLKTLIFENTNFKTINNSTSGPNAPPSGKAVGGTRTVADGKKEGSAIGELGGFSFGKVDDSATGIDFGSFNEPGAGNTSGPTTTSSSTSQAPKPIGQPRGGFSNHQASPISPQADLTEKLQGVKRIWDHSPGPTMPSVQEQQGGGGGGDHPDNSFHGSFGSDTFKGEQVTSRDQFGAPSGYAPGTSPALSAISKPESSSSPTATNLRLQKPPQQQQVDSGSGPVGGSGAGQISSSPFGGGYTMQSQGSNAFGGMPAVPSPPSVMAAYGTNQTLHAAATTGPHSGIYQTFPNVDAHQVMSAASRGAGAYGQFAAHPSAGNGQYGLFLSTPMEYSSITYQHQHGQTSGGGQVGGGGGGSRISPGPMTTQGGGNSGVIISSANSLMNAMKPPSQQPNPGQSHLNPMNHNPQQGYSQMGHHHVPPHSHPQAPPPHHLGPVGPAKPPTGYSQGGGQAQVFIPFHDPQHQQGVISLGGQNFLSSAMSRGPPGGPPPPQTPPVQALQNSSYYSAGNSASGSAVFPGQASNQAGSLQQLHVAVASPQALQGYHTTSQLGLGYPAQLNTQGYNMQAAASTVSALNLNSQMMRNAGPPQSHSAYMKQQPNLDLIGGGAQLKPTHDAQTLMNQSTWNYSINQAFHAAQQQQAGKAPGSNPNDGRNQVVGGANPIGGQRKNNLGGGGGPGPMKYMSQGPGGYSGQVQQ